MKRSFLKSAVELVTCGLVVFGAGHAYADQQKLPSGTPYDQIGQKIEDYYKEHEKTSAGLATSVFDKDGNTLYQNNFGYMDKEKKLAVDDNSVFEWGSTTKIMVWVSVMQLWEEGKLDLNADIKEYLPKDFLTNLKYDKPITMLDLMNHQESFDETPLYMGSDKSLEELLKENQPPQSYKPGELTAYSNYGTALAGYIVERVSGQSFADYVYEHIFQPLGMEHTALKPDLSDNTFVKEQRKSEKAYDTNGKSMGLTPFEVGLYPAGRATGTLADIKKFAQALLQEKTLFKKPETWKTFYTPTTTYKNGIPINIHGLWAESVFENASPIGHGGNTDGFTTMLLFDRQTGLATVVMTNQSGEQNYTVKIPEMIYGKKKSVSKEEIKNFQPGYYETARSFHQGPLSLTRTFLSTSYIADPTKNTTLKYIGYWSAGEENGLYKISLPITDMIKVSNFDVYKDYAMLILAGLAILYAAATCLLGLLFKLYRLLFKKQNSKPAPLIWSVWHYLTGASILLIPLGLFTLFNVLMSSSGSVLGYEWIFMGFAALGLGLAVSVCLPLIWRSKFQASGVKASLTLATSSAAFVIALNILYWSLYQWWMI